MEKKQTAVEWLAEQIQERVIAYDETGRKMIILIYMADYQQLIEEAKEMEREQIKSAYENGSLNMFAYYNDNPEPPNSNNYYNKTYGKETDCS